MSVLAMPHLQHLFYLRNQLLLLRHIQYISGGEDIIGQPTQDIFCGNAVLLRAEDNPDGRVIAGIINLGGVVIQVHIDLPGCLRRQLCGFQYPHNSGCCSP